MSDGQAFERWTSMWATECRRILKPGEHLVAFGAPRIAHRLASGIEDAGFELRDTLFDGDHFVLGVLDVNAAGRDLWDLSPCVTGQDRAPL